MIKKKNFTTIVFIFLCSITFAQQNGKDSIFLKNKIIIPGKIIKYNPKENVVIQTNTGKVLYSLRDIDKLTINISFNENQKDSNINSLSNEHTVPNLKVSNKDSLNNVSVNQDRNDSDKISLKTENVIQNLKDSKKDTLNNKSVVQPPKDPNTYSLNNESVFESRKGLFTIYGGIGTDIVKLQAYEDLKLSSNISVGVGTGYRYIIGEDYLPFLANIKFFGLNDDKHITWIMLSGGYCTNMNKGLKSGGYIINPTLAFGFKIQGGGYFTVGIDCDIQNGDLLKTGYVTIDANGTIQQQYHYTHGNISSLDFIVGFTY